MALTPGGGAGGGVGSQKHVLSGPTVAFVCSQIGFRGEALVTAIAVARAESSFDAWVINYASADGVKWMGTVGLFQIRCLYRPASAGNSLDRRRVAETMKSHVANASFAYQLSRGGKNWSQWSAYTGGAYRQYLDQARQWALVSDKNNPAGAATAASVPLGDNDWIDEGRDPIPVNIGADAHPGEIGNRVVTATVDYTMAEASLSRFELEDENADLLAKQNIYEGVALTVAGRRQIVTAVGARQAPGSPHLTVEAQPAGVVRLRGIVPAAVTGMSALTYARRLAMTVSMPFEGGPASPKIDIAPGVVDLGGSATTQTLDPGTGMAHGSRRENAWEVLRRLARESTGYVCFEAAGTLYFATQDWLYGHAGVVYVQVGHATFADARAGTAIRAIGFPDITRTIKRDAQNRVYRHAEVSLSLPPGPGYNALPGMRLWLAEPSGLIEGSRPLLITRTTISGGDRTALVRVGAASYSAPGDTEAQPSTVPDGDGGAGGASTGGANNGWPAARTAGPIGVASYRIPGTDVSLSIAKRASKVLVYVATEFDRRVERLVRGQCGGYFYRANVNNPSTLSNHASGTAIDLNSVRHRNGARGTFSENQLVVIRAILDETKGLIRWGGDYRHTKDEMHFEVNADPGTVKSRFG